MDTIENIHARERIELNIQHQLQLDAIKSRPLYVKTDSMWLVEYECRYEVIHVSPLGDGFFAPGQEILWDFSCVQKWIKEIKVPKNLA